jgi:hypothetical protein
MTRRKREIVGLTWDASVTVERINLLENTAKASRRKCESDQSGKSRSFWVSQVGYFAGATSLTGVVSTLVFSPC